MTEQVFSGGFLSGKKTYIVGGLMFLTALGNYATGEIGLSALIAQMPELLAGLGLMTLRAGIAKGAVK